MLILYFTWDEPERQENQSWNDEHIIKMANHGQEIRDQVEGQGHIDERRSQQPPCEPRRAWVSIHRGIKRELLARGMGNLLESLAKRHDEDRVG